MNAEGRTKRDREIVDLFLAGNRPSHIASLYDIEAVRVRRIIHAAGYEINRLPSFERLDESWDRPASALKDWFWEKQREGARQALRA